MGKIEIPFSVNTYTERRKRLASSLPNGKILLMGNRDSPMNYEDNIYPFRQDSCFLYFIGINLPGLDAIIDTETGTTTLFGDDVSLDMIIWTGPQESLASLGEKVGIQKIAGSNKLKESLSGEVRYLPPYRGEHTVRLMKLLDSREISPDQELILSIIQIRNQKSAEEIEQLDAAVSLSALMHETVIQQAQAGMKEYQLVSIASQVAWDHHAQWSFPPIMTINGQTLHNHSYGNTLKDGDMVLFDGGISIGSGYCGDMTRTWPVSGNYNEQQAHLYNTVHKAYTKSVELSKPGTYYRDVHLAAAKEITKGLIELGWMKGDPNAAVAAGAHTLFFQHGLGHMMGMDVHDMENLGEVNVGYDDTISKSKEFGLRSLRLGRELKEGFVITIEPGLYVIPELIDKFEKENKFPEFLNYNEINKNRDAGGIRIEDDYVILKDGNRRLGEPLVNDLKAIEQLRNTQA